MKLSTPALSTLLTASAAAAPTPTLQERATTISCDAWGSLQTGGYTVYHNNWGAAQATSGRQCTTFNALNGRSVAWSTSWTWAGGQNQVKSYSNVALENVGKQVSAVRSIPSTWKWSNKGDGMVANVSYDLWLSPTKGGNPAYEIMVWLGAYGGAGPISSTGSPVATVNIAGHTWQLFKGPNGDFTVFSFVVSGGPVTNFSADMKAFIDYLTRNQGVQSNYWVTSLQAGTEPFTGSNAVFTTTDYSISVS